MNRFNLHKTLTISVQVQSSFFKHRLDDSYTTPPSVLILKALGTEKQMATPTKLFSLCSLLMASLFALSSSVQFDDPDWYFWFPLYAAACGVNLINGIGVLSSKPINKIAKVAQWLGVFLFFKVVVEDSVNGIAGFWSLDLKERVVREKFGSGFVVNSMYLQLKAASIQKGHVKRKEKKGAKYVECGMAILVVVSYGMSFVFFVLQKGEVKS